jgi:glycerol uptake facilitator-like aquaporin
MFNVQMCVCANERTASASALLFCFDLFSKNCSPNQLLTQSTNIKKQVKTGVLDFEYRMFNFGFYAMGIYVCFSISLCHFVPRFSVAFAVIFLTTEITEVFAE